MYLTEKNKRIITGQIVSFISNDQSDEALKLVSRYKIRGFTMTKARAKKEYNLKDIHFNNLLYSNAPNPYYKCAGSMKLYLINDIEAQERKLKTIKLMEKLNKIIMNINVLKN